jgi:hypothetical protein
LTRPGVGLAALAALVLAMFYDVLAPGTRVLGADNTDLATHFLHWRSFGFGELAKGNLALWNPHIYGGVPYFGGMQSALLYPPNWLFLFLPAPLAANWSIALNMWLLGALMYLWALRRGLHPFAAFVAGALAMFCAPHFLRLYAGHVASMASMAWVPLIFLAIDEWLDARRPAWLLAGMAAVAMQIFAGHPQTVYLTALAAGCYSLFRLRSFGAAAGLASIYAGGAALAAVQLLPGFQATAETVRDRALPYEFAAYFSFPPENFLTLLAPGFFGDVLTQPYWGRWYLWEASAFIGVAGLALALYGIAAGTLAAKKALLGAAGVSTLLALGDNSPLFPLLFDWLPWFDRFRGAGKFIFITALLLALFAAAGLDRIVRDRSVAPGAVWAAAAGAALLGAAGLVLPHLDGSGAGRAVLASGQTYLEHALYASRDFVSSARSFAASGLTVAALTLAATAALLFWTRRQPRAATLVGVLAVLEIFAYARLNRPTFDSTRIVIAELQQFLARNPGDYRILNLVRPNSAMAMKAYDAWGYDPGLTRRYGEFMMWSMGEDPGKTIEYVRFQRFHPLLAMLRVKYVVVMDKGGVMEIHTGARPPLGRLELIGAHRVLSGRSAILEAMGAAQFDPRREVILERAPQPAPVAAATPGHARILREGTDFMEIEAEIEAPSVLLVTDAWTPAWRAVALEPGAAQRYELMPANYALRAVPLERGRHRLRLEYAPPAFRTGLLLSAAAWAAWLGAAAWLLRTWLLRKGARGA